jgi:hypothetical protein
VRINSSTAKVCDVGEIPVYTPRPRYSGSRRQCKKVEDGGLIMFIKRRARMYLPLLLAVGASGFAQVSRTADDTARMYGSWAITFPYLGRTLTLVSPTTPVATGITCCFRTEVCPLVRENFRRQTADGLRPPTSLMTPEPISSSTPTPSTPQTPQGNPSHGNATKVYCRRWQRRLQSRGIHRRTAQRVSVHGPTDVGRTDYPGRRRNHG